MLEQPSHRPVLSARWLRIFLFLTAALASTIRLKFGEIQYLELIYALQLVLLVGIFILGGMKVHILRTCVSIGSLYLLFMASALALAFVALSNPFYLPHDLTFLKHPVWITLSRDIELAIDLGVMLYLVHVFYQDRRALSFTLNVYFWTGVASAIYSILSYPLGVLNIAQLGVYNVDHRMRGFYNEGGPYGLYVVSVFLVGMALYRLHFSSRARLRLAALPLLIAFFGSLSKAAVLAAITVVVIDLLLIEGFRKRLIIFAVCILTVAILGSSVNLGKQIQLYQATVDRYERVSNLRFKDGNLVYGRIAGAFIVPRMIEAHPLAGVGWGNYGLVRNNATYRGASAWVTAYDAPSLGLPGEAAELGLPLTLLLVACLASPYLYLRHIGASLYVKNLALLQPLVHVFGANLNLTYPWVTTAFALGIGYLEVRSRAQAAASVTVPMAFPPPRPLDGSSALV